MRTDDDAEVTIFRDKEIVRFRCPDCRGSGLHVEGNGTSACSSCEGRGYKELNLEEYEEARRPPLFAVILAVLLVEAVALLIAGLLVWVVCFA